jgi:hypothetical protein
MQFTLRNVPVPLDQALRERAERQGKSLNEVTIDALLEAFGLTREPVKRRDLSDVRGTWRDDPAVDEALRDQRRVDPDLWR